LSSRTASVMSSVLFYIKTAAYLNEEKGSKVSRLESIHTDLPSVNWLLQSCRRFLLITCISGPPTFQISLCLLRYRVLTGELCVILALETCGITCLGDKSTTTFWALVLNGNLGTDEAEHKLKVSDPIECMIETLISIGHFGC
jgi:hypothetical protein